MFQNLFSLMCCTTLVVGQFVFQPENVILRNLIIDDDTGDIYLGGVNYIYKLNKNLTKLNEVNTPCLVPENCKDGIVNPNTNQILLIANITGTPRLFACGTYKYGMCITYEMQNISIFTVLYGTSGAVSNNANYTSIALEDKHYNGLLIARTKEQEGSDDYSLYTYENAAYCKGKPSPCLGKEPPLKLSKKRPKMYYILAVIVGSYRYFFSSNTQDGTNVARLCESYNTIFVIKTYVEMPLSCVGKDGTNYDQLVAAKVIRRDGKLAKKFGSTGNYDDAVLVGVFKKSSKLSQSAVCTYTFKQINEFFLKNIEKCFTSPSESVTRNRYDESLCYQEASVDECSQKTKNKEITGTIKCQSEAVVLCDDCGSISSMDTTNYRGNIIAFLGAKDGRLSKFIIYSNSSGRRYETSYRTPGSEILSIKFDRNGTSAYILTQHKVLQIPVEECSNRTTCESCVKNDDPYCGWCTLKATCMTHEKCPYYGSPLGYVKYSNKCISISSISPPSLPLSETKVQKINIPILNLPVSPNKGAYSCFVNDVKMMSTLNGDTMQCLVPKSAQLPEASSDTGLVNVEVAVLFNETNTKIATTMLEFYNCLAITSCLKCTTGSLRCSWCHYKANCTGDESSSCSKSFAQWTSNSSQHQCPQLDTQTLYIPGSIQQEVTVRGTKLPKPESPHGEYKCTFNTGTQSYSIAATWNNSTSIKCGAQQYKYSGSSIEIPANLSVKLGESNVKPTGDQIRVYLYQCKRAAKLCGSCVGLEKVEYKCGWCLDTSSCSVNDACSGTWIQPSGNCPKKPSIVSFFPPTGHVNGNTRLEINGTEFGRSYEDVEEVSIGGLQCKTIKKDYVIAKRIVCLTSNSSKSMSAEIKVVISQKIGFSKEKFHYQNPEVDDYEPKIGPVIGGTKVTIYGKQLDTGVNIKVFFGPSQCLNLNVIKTKMTCATSQFGNTTRKRRSISNNENLRVSFNGFSPVYGPNVTPFQYVPNPVINDITPRFTFPSSNTQINVTGTNLNGIHVPRIGLKFPDGALVEGPCKKPTFSNMMCPLPKLTRTIKEKVTAEFSLYLDGVDTWENLSRHPQFNSITIVPDPIIDKFPDDVFVLKSETLEIPGKHLVVDGKTDFFEFTITVGGQKCNVSSVSEVVIFCKAPDRKSLPQRDSYLVWVNVSSSNLTYDVGVLKYDIESEGSSVDLVLIYIIVGVGAGLIAIVIILMCCFYRRKKRQQEQKERTYEMQMNSLESKVAKECREAFAELQTDMTDFTTDLGDGAIHFFDFKNYAMRVLFPGVDSHDIMKDKMLKENPNWDEALRTFSQLIGNKDFLLIFVKTLESQSQFKMQDRCNVASLLVVALQSKMDYCTDILQHLLAELIRKSMSKSHPKLLLRRTECIAEKLLTNWLTFTLSHYIKDKAGKPLFMLYKAIRFQVEKGPVDAITNEARYSLSEDKLLRQSIDYNKLTVTVEFEDSPPVQVDVLDTDTIEQAKEKIIEVLFKNEPFSHRIPKDELTLKWVESPSNHTILKDEDVSMIREGEWKRLNTLGHYQVPDGTCLRLVRRFASAFDTSEIHNASVPKVSYSPSLYSTSSLIQSSKQNISDADRKPWHLTKHVDSYAQERDDPRHSKMLSEIYLTRLLSTKGTLQQYVDDMFNCIFPTFRKNERPPLPIKFLFDFLDDQALELNITDPEVLHTWKNNSLPLRFWVNLIKNPNFLFDVYKAPIVDSCLSVIAQLFMDACSVSEHILGKDSPSNKLLYAKEIPAYKQKVESFYKGIAHAPRLTDEEIKEFFASNYTEDFNVDFALKELYQYAAKYQDELQEALEDARFPQLASKLQLVVAIFSDD